MTTARSFEMALRQCRHAIRDSSTSSTAARRTFTSSASRRRAGHLPTFTESSIPELSTLLSEVRSKIFVPGYLKDAQRQLIYKAKHRQMLLSEPFIVDIGDEEIQLLPLDRTKDIPDSWKSIRDAMRLFGDDAQQWQNLLGLLEGFHTVGRKWSQQHLEDILRLTGESGMTHILVEAARRVKRTGITLKDARITRRIVWACVQKAALDDFSEEATARAVSYAGQIARLMEREEHCGNLSTPSQKDRELIEMHGDPRRLPEIIGAQLFLHAVYAVKHQGGVDTDGAVERLIPRLLPNLKNKECIAIETIPDNLAALRSDLQLARWVPVLRGLQLSDKILGSRLPQPEEVNRSVRELTEKAQQWRDEVAQKSTPEQIERARPGTLLYDTEF